MARNPWERYRWNGHAWELKIPARCTMPTATGRECSRPGRYLYRDRNGATVALLCAQHDRSTAARILRPRAWEYSDRRDIVALGVPR